MFSIVGFVGCGTDTSDAAVVAYGRRVEVYIVDEFVPKGADAETIKASVSIEQIPERLEQPDVIVDLHDVDGMIALVDMEPGDQLLASRLLPAD
jgi:pilus assembly protein CpaB